MGDIFYDFSATPKNVIDFMFFDLLFDFLPEAFIFLLPFLMVYSSYFSENSFLLFEYTSLELPMFSTSSLSNLEMVSSGSIEAVNELFTVYFRTET